MKQKMIKDKQTSIEIILTLRSKLYKKNFFYHIETTIYQKEEVSFSEKLCMVIYN